jgi:hypothetical protein
MSASRPPQGSEKRTPAINDLRRRGAFSYTANLKANINNNQKDEDIAPPVNPHRSSSEPTHSALPDKPATPAVSRQKNPMVSPTDPMERLRKTLAKQPNKNKSSTTSDALREPLLPPSNVHVSSIEDLLTEESPTCCCFSFFKKSSSSSTKTAEKTNTPTNKNRV